MQAQVNITEDNEANLERINALLAINGIKKGNKSDLINKTIEVLADVLKNITEKNLIELTSLKKTY